MTDKPTPIDWVRVMADHSADPVWGLDGAMIDLEDLDLSPVLLRRFRKWADRYEAQESVDGDSFAREHAGFTDQGLFLAAHLKEFRPALTVFYHDESKWTGVKGQDRSEFEYEITAEMADALIAKLNWPVTDYMHGACAICQTPFFGPKREPHCHHCDQLHLAPRRPQTILLFTETEEEGKVPGLPNDRIPGDIHVITTRYLRGTARVLSMITGACSEEQLDLLHTRAKFEGLRMTVLKRDMTPVTGNSSIYDLALCDASELSAGALATLTRRALGDDAMTGTRPLRNMRNAPRDGTAILLRYHFNLGSVRADLADFSGLVFVGRNRADEGGADEWGFAAPVGYGGIPDAWLQGWAPISEGIEV